MAYGVVSAHDAGAPHLRKRWWCLAKRTASPRLPSFRATPSYEKMWLTEPVPRVIPQESIHTQKKTQARGALLGNSVVPDCVVLATNILSKALAKESKYPIYKSKHLVKVHVF